MDDANLAPTAIGQKKLQRDLEKKREAQEHKKRLAAMKKKKAGPPSRFARGGLNAAFMANAKKERIRHARFPMKKVLGITGDLNVETCVAIMNDLKASQV